jgi:putative endopeptidase
MKGFLIYALIFFQSWMTSCKHLTQQEQKQQEHKTLSLQFIDKSVKPGDNFFLYANGKWVDTVKIPPTEFRYGSRVEMENATKAAVKEVLQDAASANAAKGTIKQKVGDFYASGMNSTAIDKLGYDPVKPILKQISGLKDANDVMKFAAMQCTYHNQLIIGMWVGPDDKNSSINLLGFSQSGLGLPNRDYYFSGDAGHFVVAAYQKYMRQLFMLSGDDSVTAATNVATVFKLEMQMAASHRKNEDLRDPQTNYNRVAVADLDKKMPAIGWSQLMNNLRIKTDSINLAQPNYYSKLNDLLGVTPIETWKTYLRFHVLDGAASALSNDFVTANFQFNGITLNGQKEIKPRWERVYETIDENLGEALGQLYVEKNFSPEAKKKTEDLVNNLQVAFEARITKLDWMSDSTKQKAIEKLHAIIKKIGYPDVWRDYSAVTIDGNDYFGNLERCKQNQYNFEINKIGKQVDKSEWEMTAPTDNAYYNPMYNEIVFPAGILRFPMFDPASDDALNYGAIGWVIGHEMTHAFDDRGAQYDKDGNLKNWWTKTDSEKFKTKGQQVVDFYNNFVVLDTVHVNGKLTLGENIADIGGIAIAYDAFKLTKEGKDTTRIDGFTPDQRFFLAFAQAWRMIRTPEALLRQVKTDTHSPSNYRVLGPLENFTPFYSAFNVNEGDKMFVREDKRIKIW